MTTAISVSGGSELSGANALLFKLCSRITGQRGLSVQSHFVRSLQALAVDSSCGANYSLLTCDLAIERLLSRHSRQRDAVRIKQLVARLQSADSAGAALIVMFLYRVSSLHCDNAGLAGGSGGLLYLPAVWKLTDSSAAGGDDIRKDCRSQRLNADSSSTVSSVSTGAAKQTDVVEFDSRMEMLRELLFALRGVDGRMIRVEGKWSGVLCSRLKLNAGEVTLLRSLTQLGWLYRRVTTFCRASTARSSAGLAAHALSAAVNRHLDNYYQLLSVIETQLESANTALTLRRLLVWTYEPRVQLCQLAALLDRCASAGGGGALVSVLHAALQHGDADWRRSVRYLLAAACRPLFILLGDWLLDGVLDDKHAELFIECDTSVPDDRLWHDKYKLRMGQVPTFLSVEQAQKVLVTGKSVNFLRRVCASYRGTGTDRSLEVDTKTSAASRREYDSCAGDALSSESNAGRLDRFIDRVYLHKSRSVLDTLYSSFQLRDHMNAVRDFLLLARGDFVSHLMELLADELARSANQLYLHNLTAVLETAVRATNAQYAPVDVLRRLDVRVLTKSPGDVGWDVFSLDYHTDGPTRTVLTNTHLTNYLLLFHALWRCKRLEFTLSRVWRRQAWLTRRLRTARLSTAAAPLLHLTSTLTGQMVHFIRQLSYYTAFEVLECSWAELQRRLVGAESLDQLLSAHSQFVNVISAGTLLDKDSASLLLQLRAIYNMMLEFEHQHERVTSAVVDELRQRDEYDEKLAARTRAGQFAMDADDERREAHRRRQFVCVTLPTSRSRLETMTVSYQRVVVDFLMAVSSASRVADRLQCLSFRLDFNRHYECHEPRLSLPFTYQHRRLSSSKHASTSRPIVTTAS